VGNAIVEKVGKAIVDKSEQRRTPPMHPCPWDELGHCFPRLRNAEAIKDGDCDDCRSTRGLRISLCKRSRPAMGGDDTKKKSGLFSRLLFVTSSESWNAFCDHFVDQIIRGPGFQRYCLFTGAEV